MDKYILEFVGNNWLTIYIIVTALKGIALITPTVKDDKIITLFVQIYNALRGGKIPEKMEDLG